jgi:acetyl esterase/lipase
MQAKLFFHPPRGTRKSWTSLGGIEALKMVPPAGKGSDKTVFYIHGGGFTFGSPSTHAAMAAQLAERIGACAVLPKYRLGPEDPYPAAPDDVRAAWDGLMALGVAPSDVVIGGDSAGGALGFGLLADLVQQDAPLPAAVFGFSPLTDLSYSGESFVRNAEVDAVLPASSAPALSEMFLSGKPCDDLRVSPLSGSFTGAPPLWMTVGDTEILQDDARRLTALCRAQGVDATLVEVHDVPHVWPIFHNILPEARESLYQLAAWIRQQPGWQGES